MTDQQNVDYAQAEEWVRNVRGFVPKAGPWHLVKVRAERSHGWSRATVCGFHPDYSHQQHAGRPAEGKVCPKCQKAAEQRYRPGTAGGDDRG